MKEKVLYAIFFIFAFCIPTGSFCYAQGNGFSPTLSYLNANLPTSINLKVRDTVYPLAKADVIKWLGESTSLIYNPTYLSEIENPDFCQYDKSIACELEFRTENENHIQKKSELDLDENAIKNFVVSLAKKTDKAPEDAKLKMEDGKVSVFSLSDKGLTLDQEKSSQVLIDYINSGNYKNAIDLPYKETDPETPNIGSIDSLGINTLIGEGQSNFAGSPQNRVHNIKVGTERFDGVLIKPGEEFSFIKTLGPVDQSTGYLPELVIKPNETVPEFGGGMCQVSTTAFRAALNAGLKITERVNHAYPVSYYNPQGMDATVYIPQPDLRFKNNTPSYILIQTRIVGTQLFFDFYGTDDGRSTTLDGPTILEHNPDGSMKTTLAQTVKDKDGNIIIQDTFKSDYQSPSKFPHPGQTPVLTSKPENWSDREWKAYKQGH